MGRDWTPGAAGARTLLLAVLPFLVSCQTVQLDLEDRSRIRVIYVDPAIEVPEPEMVDQGVALMGLVGFIAAHVEGSNRKDSISEAMSSNGIDIAEIVRSEFEMALVRWGLFRVGEASESHATIHLEVYRLGMHRPIGFNFELKPIVGIKASLVDPSGRVVWRRGEVTTNLSEETPGYSYDEYLAQPVLIRKAFSVAIYLTVMDLVDHLCRPW